MTKHSISTTLTAVRGWPLAKCRFSKGSCMFLFCVNKKHHVMLWSVVVPACLGPVQ